MANLLFEMEYVIGNECSISSLDEWNYKGCPKTYHLLSGHQCENLTIIQGLHDGT